MCILNVVQGKYGVRVVWLYLIVDGGEYDYDIFSCLKVENSEICIIM